MEEDDFISKSQRKRDSTALQVLGAELVKLAPEQLARIDMPESLRDAVSECRKITKHEARRRQMQYIGRIMRDLDAGPIAQQLAAMHAPTHAQTALFHRAEEWRDDMLADDDAITRFVQDFPEADPRQLRVMAEKARAERAGERPPKHYRELFHAVNGILQGEGRKKR